MLEIFDTDLGKLFPLGLGSMKANNGWDRDQTFRMFDLYTDLGGNVLDTARVYSVFSKSEEWIGEWLASSGTRAGQSAGKRERVVIISKGGHPDITTPVVDMHAPRLEKAEMEKDLDASLRALRTDFIDIYLYHRDDERVPVAEHMEVMEDFVRAGKIRHYGCSNWRLERIREAVRWAGENRARGFVMNQAFLNAASDHAKPLADDTLVSMDPEMRKFHAEEPRVLAAAYSGMAQGFFEQYLTGGADAVKQKSYLTPENEEIARNIARVAAESGTTVLQETIRYFMTLGMPCLPLVTPRDEKSLREMMAVFLEQ